MDVADCYSLLTLIITPNPDLDLDLDLDRRAMVITHTYAKVDVKHDLERRSENRRADKHNQLQYFRANAARY